MPFFKLLTGHEYFLTEFEHYATEKQPFNCAKLTPRPILHNNTDSS